MLEIDLTQAINIDSTCLGLLAKLAMQYEVETQSQPQLCCPHAHLIDLVESLGLEACLSWLKKPKRLMLNRSRCALATRSVLNPWC